MEYEHTHGNGICYYCLDMGMRIQKKRVQPILQFYGDIMTYGSRPSQSDFKHSIDIDRGKKAKTFLSRKD